MRVGFRKERQYLRFPSTNSTMETYGLNIEQDQVLLHRKFKSFIRGGSFEGARNCGCFHSKIDRVYHTRIGVVITNKKKL